MFPLWHYTIAQYAQSIIRDREIKMTRSVGEYERPAVWVSSNQQIEHTSRKGVSLVDGTRRQLSFSECVNLLGLCRFGFNPNDAMFISWEDYKKTSGLLARHAKSMEQVGQKQRANCNQWFASYEPLPLSKSIAQQQYLDGFWKEIGGEGSIVIPTSYLTGKFHEISPRRLVEIDK